MLECSVLSRATRCVARPMRVRCALAVADLGAVHPGVADLGVVVRALRYVSSREEKYLITR